MRIKLNRATACAVLVAASLRAPHTFGQAAFSLGDVEVGIRPLEAVERRSPVSYRIATAIRPNLAHREKRIMKPLCCLYVLAQDSEGVRKFFVLMNASPSVLNGQMRVLADQTAVYRSYNHPAMLIRRPDEAGRMVFKYVDVAELSQAMPYIDKSRDPIIIKWSSQHAEWRLSPLRLIAWRCELWQDATLIDSKEWQIRDKARRSDIPDDWYSLSGFTERIDAGLYAYLYLGN